MSEQILDFYKRLLFVGVQVIFILFLLAFILSSLKTNNSQVRAATPASNPSDMSSSPNVITSGAADTIKGLERIAASTTNTINSGVSSLGSAVASSAKFVGNGLNSGFSTAGRAAGSGINFVASAPGDVIGAISNTEVIDSVLRPNDNVEVPIIAPNSPELQAALAAIPPSAPEPSTVVQNNSGSIWPIHGRITADFGVSHRPYQHTHTGLDISNGQPVGTTPVHPFRSGKVIEVVHSRKGLGNHVIVDHGGGITSVYAHLHSISANVGQEVDHSTTVGFVGTTGLSTGPHLHFEIRVNGKAADPKKFITGRP